MNIIIMLVIGAFAGWIAGLIMQGRGFGIIGNIVVGITGSFIGWFIFNLLDIARTDNWSFLIASVIGALVLLFIAGYVPHRAN